MIWERWFESVAAEAWLVIPIKGARRALSNDGGPTIGRNIRRPPIRLRLVTPMPCGVS